MFLGTCRVGGDEVKLQRRGVANGRISESCALSLVVGRSKVTALSEVGRPLLLRGTCFFMANYEKPGLFICVA